MSSRRVIAVAVGVSVLFLSQWGLVELSRLLQACCFTSNLVSPLWVGAISNVAFALASLLPGFIAGWISTDRGILLGFLTGAIGSVCYAALFKIIPIDSSWLQIAMSGSTAVWLAGSALGLALTCAAGGGAAQALRSNNALEQCAANGFVEGRAMLKFGIKCLRWASRVPRIAQRGR